MEAAGTTDNNASLPSDKAWKRKAKKLRKKAQNGEISTQEQLRECEKYGIVVKPEVEWASSCPGTPTKLDADMARDAIVFLLTGKGNQPKWLSFKNLGLVSRVVVVGLSGVDCPNLTKSLSQLPFLHACSTPRPVGYYRGLHPRRLLYSLLFYPPKKGQDNTEADQEEDEDDEDDGDDAMSLKGWEAGVPPNDLGLDPVEKFVLTPAQLKSWGYLIPPSEVNGEGGGGGDEEEAEEEEEEEDLGVCVALPSTTTATGGDGGHAALAWLEAGDGGVWSPALLPPLEEARSMLATLPTICQATSEPEPGIHPKYYYQTVPKAEGQTPLPYKMAAMDCEMCQTGEGNEVTRVTVVDENKKVLLDSFIKPYSPITDYHTKYSGITAEIMDKCDTRLEQVQVALLRLIRAGTTLVGHSLEQDLLVTRIIHLRCIDTSIIYPHPRGNQRRFALRVLTKKYLKRVIQDSRHGHCSEEDAVAALELVQLKVERGAEFGVEGALGEDVKGRDSLLDVLHQHGRRSALLDESENLVKCVRGQTAAVVCRSNEDTLNKFRAQTNLAVPPHFIFASLQATKPPTMQAAQARRKRRQHEEAAAALAPPFPKKQKVLPSSPPPPSFVLGKGKHTTFECDEESITEMVDATLLRTDQILREMFETLPPSTLMMVLTQPDLTLPFQLTRQRMACQDVRAVSRWRQEDEKLLNDLCDEGKSGRMFFRVR